MKLTNSKEVAHLNFQKDTTALLTGQEQDEGPNLSFCIFVKKCYSGKFKTILLCKRRFLLEKWSEWWMLISYMFCLQTLKKDMTRILFKMEKQRYVLLHSKEIVKGFWEQLNCLSSMKTSLQIHCSCCLSVLSVWQESDLTWANFLVSSANWTLLTGAENSHFFPKWPGRVRSCPDLTV